VNVELKNTLLVRDHYHLKNTIWPEQIGLQLYIRFKTHLEGALDCHTEQEYHDHCNKLYHEMVEYPNHVEYFKKYFNNPKSIAKYKIKKVRGSLCCIASSNAEATHSSNEAAVPTALIGIVSIQEQILLLLKREDDWIRRDLTEHQELELFRASKSCHMTESSIEFNALYSLSSYSFEKHFRVEYKLSKRLRKVTVNDDTNMSLIGHDVLHCDGDGSEKIFIKLGERCPNPSCISKNIQCRHEMVIDEIFHLDKWGVRYWSDDKYRTIYSNDTYHFNRMNVELPQLTQFNDDGLHDESNEFMEGSADFDDTASGNEVCESFQRNDSYNQSESTYTEKKIDSWTVISPANE
jgi:hypothetical protein